MAWKPYTVAQFDAQDTNVHRLPVAKNVEQAWNEYETLIKDIGSNGNDPAYIARVNHAYSEFERLYKRWAA